MQSQAFHFYQSVSSRTDAKKAQRFFHSQHSGARRADEAAHCDVGVSNPGLVALEAVFVYSGLGQLPDLAGADLLVVPVLSVRHFNAPVPVTLLLNLLRSATWSTLRPHYANAFMQLHPLNARLRGGEARQMTERDAVKPEMLRMPFKVRANNRWRFGSTTGLHGCLFL